MPGSRLFAYGTLRDQDVLSAVLGRVPAIDDSARMHGHVALTVIGDSYPILVPRAGAITPGSILSGLAPADWLALDRYEGPGYRRLPVRVSTAGGMIPADVYFPLRGLRATDSAWDLADWARRCKPAFLRRLRP